MGAEQTQLPVMPPPILRVVDDYGPVGTGASQARIVLAENSQEYIVKGPSFVPSHPHVAANEYVAARLARAIGLPVLDFTIVDLAGAQLFASACMTAGTFHAQTTEDLFNRCENRDRVYDLVVFDVWLRNTDRHHENLLVREVRPRNAENPRLHLLCNDHGHCLVCPNEQATVLAEKLDAPPAETVKLGFVINAITETSRLAAALARVSAVDDGIIEAAFAEMPATFVPSAQEAGLMRDYLFDRRARLANVFQTHRATFSSLDEGEL
jgi:Phosphatidylinositol 3- and 4-kinase